ncbi:MAG TPA: M14 family zinc carboxypeptidase [Gemmatimonadaceae bacterium]|nr:M14 family zinc carboxypeptidase [Gemmatimonadaceae bacterium]
MRVLRCAPRHLLGALLLWPGVALAQTAAAPAPTVAPAEPLDAEYTATIRELTPTDPKWKFTTELVDHLPASSSVPTPLKVLGYVPGTIGRLSKVADVNRYFEALDAASPRMQRFSLGMSDEGREMIVVAIADEATIARLDDYKRMLARLADPRGLAPTERERLLREAKPAYWLTGSIHSPETGSPEMLMELGYRLAVSESEHVRAIRANVITLITPVVEVDGRDRVVDAYQQSKRLGLGSNGTPLVYWGKYTAHDNNRDGMVVSQKLTQHILKGFLDWKPVVMHDLHESVPFLYASTGTGPYNDQFDPMVVDEWHTLAYQEIGELTKRGLPGVWTHGFYDGWTPNYMLAIANFHNSIGRFYETYTSSGADCHTVDLREQQTSREWDRPNPPVNGVKWCIRSNINYQQSGVLVALRYVADHRQQYLDNYVTKAQRQIERGRREAPHAFVIPRGQRRAAEAADLVNLFRQHGAEVHVAGADFRATAMAKVVERGQGGGRAERDAADTVAVKAGDWIVRLDQPYTQMVRTLLAVQRFKADDPSPYDDTGWTLDELRHVLTHTIADSTILSRPMTPLAGAAQVAGGVSGSGSTVLVPHLGDWRSAIVPFRLKGMRVQVAERAFRAGGREWPAGTYVVRGADAGAVGKELEALALQGTTVADLPADAALRAVRLPRIALLHSWIETQNEGWVRYAFDQMHIPYVYLSDQDLRDPKALDAVDAVYFEHVSARGASLLNGRPMVGPPVPWKRSAQTPSLGRYDETDDVRPGMGLEGAATLRRFVERGGLLVVTGNSTSLPIDLGFNPAVQRTEPRALKARGGVFRAQTVTAASPILYGYERSGFPVYFNQAPLLSVSRPQTRAETPAVIKEAQEKQTPRVVLRFHEKADSLLLSGLLDGGQELVGKAAVIDAPVGKGHVVLFAIRPIWRHESQGSFAMPLNAIVHWNALDTPLVSAREGRVATEF